MPIDSFVKEGHCTIYGWPQCYSPGKYAKYCSYSLVEQKNKIIVHMETKDKGQVFLQSPNMEREALHRSLTFLSSRINIGEVITDASTSVKKPFCNSGTGICISKWIILCS